MATHTITTFSPSKTNPGAWPRPQRKIQPSSEKGALRSIVFIKRSSSTTEAGSPVKKCKGDSNNTFVQNTQFELRSQGDEAILPKLHDLVQASRHIQLSSSLVSDGRARLPSREEFYELANLFPTTFAVEVEPPFVVFRVRTLPPKPWPLTVGGLPVWLTTEAYGGTFNQGAIGKAAKILDDVNLREKDCPMELLEEVTSIFQERNIRLREILWCFGWFRVVVGDEHDLESLPFRIAHCPAFYHKASEVEKQDASALRNKVMPSDTIVDDTSYLGATSVLRPGIMLGSSSIRGQWLSTTSGMLVADSTGEVYVTVASHGFQSDGLVHHPGPNSRVVIGRIDRHIPRLDVSLVKLNKGLKYVNETFGDASSSGVMLSGMAAILRGFDPLTMNNPFTGSCEGVLLGSGFRVEGEEATY